MLRGVDFLTPLSKLVHMHTTDTASRLARIAAAARLRECGGWFVVDATGATTTDEPYTDEHDARAEADEVGGEVVTAREHEGEEAWDAP